MKLAKNLLIVSALLTLVAPVASADDSNLFDLSRLWAWFTNLETPDEGGYLDPNGAETDEGGFVDPYGANAEGGVFMDPLGITTDEGGWVDPNGRGYQSAPRPEGSGLDPHGLPNGTQNATGTGDKGMGLDPNG